MEEAPLSLALPADDGHSLQVVHSALEACLAACKRQDPRTAAQKLAENWAANGKEVDELLTHMIYLRTFANTCAMALKGHGFKRTGWFQEFFTAVHQHTDDRCIRGLTQEIEAQLGCQPDLLFGMAWCGTMTLEKARKVMTKVLQILAQKELRAKFHSTGFGPKWPILEHALRPVAVAFGFGFDGQICMLGMALAHSADPVVARGGCALERCIGLQVLRWRREEAQAYAEEMVKLYSTPAFVEWRVQLDARHAMRSAPWYSARIAHEVELEAALFEQYGLPANKEGIVTRTINMMRFMEDPLVAAAMLGISSHRPMPMLTLDCCSVSDCSSSLEPPCSLEGHSWDSTAAESVAPDHDPPSSSRISALESLVVAKDRHIASLTAQLAQQGKQQSEVWTLAVVRDREISRLALQVAAQGDVIARLQAEATTKDREIAAFTARIAQYADEVAQVQGQALAADQLAAELAAAIVGQGKGFDREAEAMPSHSQVHVPVFARLTHQAEEITKKEEELSLLRAQLLGQESEISRLSKALCDATSEHLHVEEQHQEICLLHSRLAAEVDSTSLWRAEALDLDRRVSQLQATMLEYRSVTEDARKFFSIPEDVSMSDEEAIDTQVADPHRRTPLFRGSPGWSQIEACFRGCSSRYHLAKVELIQNQWLELACQGMYHTCATQAASGSSALLPFPADMAKQRTLSILDQHRVLAPQAGANLVWAWHACDPRSVHDFARTGFNNMAHTDSGFFGSGHYCSLEADYACERAACFPGSTGTGASSDECWCIVLVLVVLGTVRPLAWCDEDFHMHDCWDPRDCKHYGRRLQRPVNTHVVPVRKRGVEYLIADGKTAEYHDLIVDQDSQVLPFAVCWFDEEVQRPPSHGRRRAAARARPASR